jgi:hypothetical protein
MNFEIIKLSEVYPLELKNIFYNFIKEKKLLYPKFEEWFNKILIENYNFPNKREIFICINKEKLLINICGIMILKNYKKEKKICTLYVLENFRNKKIGSQMIKKSFEYLRTNKPFITIPEEEYLNFKPLLNKFNFIETKRIKGYYRKDKIEYFYN